MTKVGNIADPAAGLCAYLSVQIGDLLSPVPASVIAPGGQPAVFRPRVPQKFQDHMPAACVTVQAKGGYKLFGTGLMPVADPNLEVICYGETSQQSYMVALAATRAMRALTQSVWDGVLLYWVRIAGGPIPLDDAQTLWPATWMNVQMMYSEIAEA